VSDPARSFGRAVGHVPQSNRSRPSCDGVTRLEKFFARSSRHGIRLWLTLGHAQFVSRGWKQVGRGATTARGSAAHLARGPSPRCIPRQGTEQPPHVRNAADLASAVVGLNFFGPNLCGTEFAEYPTLQCLSWFRLGRRQTADILSEYFCCGSGSDPTERIAPTGEVSSRAQLGASLLAGAIDAPNKVN
jgi:hypothetical protein